MNQQGAIVCNLTPLKLYIENSSADSANALIYGEFDNDLVRINGDLDVTDGFKFTDGNQAFGKLLTSDANGNASWQLPTAVDDGDWTISGNDLYSANSGNVGIGITSPIAPLDIRGDASTLNIQPSLNNRSAYADFYNFNRSVRGIIGVDGPGFSGTSNQFTIATWTNHPIKFFTNQVERMSLENDGDLALGIASTGAERLYVKKSSQPSAYTAIFHNDGYTSADATLTTEYGGIKITAGRDVHNGVNSALIYFSRPDGGQLGGIAQTGPSGIGLVTTSDVRLKTNITPTHFGLADLMKIEVRDYAYKEEPNAPRTGFIAQQLYTVYPDIVKVGGEDPKTDPWMVDYAMIAPLLVKSVQDQQKEIEELKKQIEEKDEENGGLQANLETLEERLQAIEAQLNPETAAK